MVPKKHFLVFCAIFLTVALLLGIGAWRTRAEVESRVAPGEAGGPTPEGGPAIRRAADPPPGAPGDR